MVNDGFELTQPMINEFRSGALRFIATKQQPREHIISIYRSNNRVLVKYAEGHTTLCFTFARLHKWLEEERERGFLGNISYFRNIKISTSELLNEKETDIFTQIILLQIRTDAELWTSACA